MMMPHCPLWASRQRHPLTTARFGINEQLSLWSGLATAPIFIWELSIGIWMVVKGFKPSHSQPGWSQPARRSPIRTPLPNR
jgi:hypothetical protein